MGRVTVCSVSMGHTSEGWLFEPGALVNERVAVREIFGVPEGADVSEGSDKVLIELEKISSWYMQFAGHFVWEHTS